MSDFIARRNKLVLLFALLLMRLLIAASAVQAGQVVYEVREQLNPTDVVAYKLYSQRWSNPTAELLRYPFSAPEGACHPASLRLEGPDGETAVQLADVKTWGDTPFVRTATLYFLMPDYPEPLSTRRYTLTYGATPRPTREPDEAPFVRVVEEENEVILVTYGGLPTGNTDHQLGDVMMNRTGLQAGVMPVPGPVGWRWR